MSVTVTATETTTATAETTKYFEKNQIVLWHYSDPQWRIPVTGIVTAADNKTQKASIKVRNLSGQIEYLDDIAYSEIEARA